MAATTERPVEVPVPVRWTLDEYHTAELVPEVTVELDTVFAVAERS